MTNEYDGWAKVVNAKARAMATAHRPHDIDARDALEQIQNPGGSYIWEGSADPEVNPPARMVIAPATVPDIRIKAACSMLESFDCGVTIDVTDATHWTLRGRGPNVAVAQVLTEAVMAHIDGVIIGLDDAAARSEADAWLDVNHTHWHRPKSNDSGLWRYQDDL